MPEVQEVFRMATQKVRPDPGALERQHRDQRWRVAKRKTAVYALVAALVVAGAVIGIGSLDGDGGGPAGPGDGQAPVPTPTPLPVSGTLEPGTYFPSVVDPEFDAAHRITFSVPGGYEAYQGWGILKIGTDQTAVHAWVVGNVYADPCQWSGTELDPPVGQDLDALVAALANQPGRNASTPTDVTVDGYAGKRLELTTPAGMDPSECDLGEYRSWIDTGGGSRFTEAGQLDVLWIIDVDGVPLVIDAATEAGTSEPVQAEIVRIAESVRID